MTFDRSNPGRTAGFTLVEISIAIAVVAFALVAIMGVLPTGMQVQKENREETIINQDARLLMEGIRSGGTNLHNLAGNLEWIQYSQNGTGVTNRWIPRDGNTTNNSWFGLVPPNVQYAVTDPAYGHSGARDIIGHLSAPSYDFLPPRMPLPVGSVFPTNFFRTQARFLANSGGPLALEANNARQLAFSYLVTSEVFPFRTIGAENLVLSNNLWEVRLTFQWPVYGPPRTNSPPRPPHVGKGKAVFRTTVAGQLLLDADGSNYFFHSLQHGRVPL